MHGGEEVGRKFVVAGRHATEVLKSAEHELDGVAAAEITRRSSTRRTPRVSFGSNGSSRAICASVSKNISGINPAPSFWSLS